MFQICDILFDFYRYLSNGACDASSTANNKVKFETINKCFETIGFKTQVRESVIG